MSKVRVTGENWHDFEQAVCQKLAQPLSITVYEQYNVWRFLGDIGFEFTGPQGVKVVEKYLMPKVLEKVPDAKFMVIVWQNGFSIVSNELWTKACLEASPYTPHANKNVPVIKLP